MRSSDWSSDVCSSDLYRVVGICYWLSCGVGGCRIRTSIKVRHYVPDAVVSGYSNTGANPWVEVRPMSLPNPTAQAGGDGTTNEGHENNIAKFKNKTGRASCRERVCTNV